MPGGYRWMYQLTGLPGWMRFGFSPGWIGRSSTGLGPAASYLMTGQWPTPQMQAYWQGMQSGQVPYPIYAGVGGGPFASTFTPGAYPFSPQMTPEQELDFLKNQAKIVKEQLKQIDSRIEELEKK